MVNKAEKTDKTAHKTVTKKVLVQKNPLEDLTTMQKPQAIMIQGKFIQRDELQLELNLIRQKYLRQ